MLPHGPTSAPALQTRDAQLDRPKMRPVHSLTLLCIIGLLGACSQTKPIAHTESKKEPEPSYLQGGSLNGRALERGRSLHRKEAPPQDHRYERRPGMRRVSPWEGGGRIRRCQPQRHARQRVRLYQERVGRENIRGARDTGQTRSAWVLVSAARSRDSDRPTAGDHEFRSGDAQCPPARRSSIASGITARVRARPHSRASSSGPR